MKKTLLFFFSCILFFSMSAQTSNLEKAYEAFSAGEYNKAIELSSVDLVEHPSSAYAYYYRAYSYYYLDNNLATISDINSAIKFSTTKDADLKANMYELRAKIYAYTNELENAIQFYTTAIKLNPKDLDYYFGRGQTYLRMKNYIAAENEYKTILKLDESDERGYYGLGNTFLLQKKYSQAEDILNKLIRLAPESAEGYYYKAKTLYAQEQYNEAISNLFKSLEIDSDDSNRINLFYEYSTKNYPLALSLLNTKLLDSKDNDFWLYVRAKFYEMNEKYISAIYDYTKVFEVCEIDNQTLILYRRANCYTESGLFDEAIKDYNQVLQNDSNNAYYIANRGLTYQLMGNYPQAVLDFTKAIALEPTEQWFYYRRGWILDEFQGNHEAGLKDYNQAIALDSSYAYTYLNRARVLIQHFNSVAKGNEDFLQILQLDTVQSSQGNCRQYALMELGRNDEAIQWMNKILDTYPTAGNYYDAACLFSGMNKSNEAISALKSAFENGFRSFDQISDDDDLDNIRHLPAFIELVQKWKNTFEKMERDQFKIKKDINSQQYNSSNIV